LNEKIDASGTEIINQQGAAADGSEITHTTFETTDVTSDVQISEDLTEIVQVYDDDSDPNSVTGQLVNQIKLYAGQIQCSDFHGKGTIDDYSALFVAASKIANDTKQMQLDIDIDGFNEFGQAADELSSLFTSFIKKLENVNIINDVAFLTSISIALGKIVNLSNVFGRFKETILATSTIKLPKSAHDTKLVLEGVMAEINCAMNYIGHFVSPTVHAPSDASLSIEEQTIISKAVSTIENWSVICDQGVSIAMTNNPDIQYIKSASEQLKTTTSTLNGATAALRAKLTAFNLSN